LSGIGTVDDLDKVVALNRQGDELRDTVQIRCFSCKSIGASDGVASRLRYVLLAKLRLSPQYVENVCRGLTQGIYNHFTQPAACSMALVIRARVRVSKAYPGCSRPDHTGSCRRKRIGDYTLRKSAVRCNATAATHDNFLSNHPTNKTMQHAQGVPCPGKSREMKDLVHPSRKNPSDSTPGFYPCTPCRRHHSDSGTAEQLVKNQHQVREPKVREKKKMKSGAEMWQYCMGRRKMGGDPMNMYGKMKGQRDPTGEKQPEQGS